MANVVSTLSFATLKIILRLSSVLKKESTWAAQSTWAADTMVCQRYIISAGAGAQSGTPTLVPCLPNMGALALAPVWECEWQAAGAGVAPGGREGGQNWAGGG